MVSTEPAASDRGGLIAAVRREWSEIGPVGRVAFAGVVLSLGVAVVLGLWIPSLVRSHLLDSRAELISSIADEIASRGLVPVGPPGSQSYETLEEEIRLSLLGGETVRVKLWTVDGVVAYSDDPRLVGRSFGLTPTASKALAGTASYAVSDLSEPAHAYERPLGELLEVFVPVHDATGTVVGLFEVEDRLDALNTTIGRVRHNVWLAIGTGIGLAVVFMGALTIAAARALNRRSRQAERLLGSLFRAQEEERRRVVGALHDDIGQPLFRLLYGLEGSRAKLEDGHPVRPELERLADITRGLDRTLRGELRLLHQGVDAELGLGPALRDVVETARTETDLTIDLDLVDVGDSVIGEGAKAALVHAVREAIINVRKHAGASHVVVTLRRSAQDLEVSVRDDGSGARAPEGLGIVTTRERLEAIGGSLRLVATRGRGTTFTARIPIIGGES